ncbi:Holliday junction resolvase RecU [Brevibacillus reuszeri]|uniref:Holliday junction resolvase RecU n=1 Tax=Brevibacillus reuszeri TaxID=54915 RepID=A0A0K9YLH7_9BACL|nr:Holliday junction resolvase RecU [Brevibacillus reuszeri]KNB69512.1 recombinase RecU [Brevibacillus reuszeri]MED1856123.1 Holliday junction resolvase RecU [Brevibacillus reuszeri]GED71210.1 Holliday junction resolvase RecU [Brevibacillus reuszeri]
MQLKTSQANRGKGFEDLLNYANEQYERASVALIHKRPTPIKATKTKGSRILSGYFEEKSTVDYDGVYRGRAVYFEAKSTRDRTRFDLDNISKHQIEHLEKTEKMGAVCFLLIEFSALKATYFVSLSFIRMAMLHAQNGGRKSIPIEDFDVYGCLVTQTKRAVLDYLVHVDKLIGIDAA